MNLGNMSNILTLDATRDPAYWWLFWTLSTYLLFLVCVVGTFGVFTWCEDRKRKREHAKWHGRVEWQRSK